METVHNAIKIIFYHQIHV